MTAGDRQWVLAEQAIPLPFGFEYRVARVGSGAGPLSHLDEPIAVASVGSLVVMLSTSAAMLSTDPQTTVNDALDELLMTVPADPSPPRELLSKIGRRLSDLFNAGAFRSAVPSGAMVAVSVGNGIAALKFGPVGVAAISAERVQLLHQDDRYPALRAQGIKLEELIHGTALAANPQLLAASSLTQLDPAQQQPMAFDASSTRDSLLLMSRGALPTAVPPPSEPLAAWARAVCGCTHGMPGMVVQVYRADAPQGHDLSAWIGHRPQEASGS